MLFCYRDKKAELDFKSGQERSDGEGAPGDRDGAQPMSWDGLCAACSALAPCPGDPWFLWPWVVSHWPLWKSGGWGLSSSLLLFPGCSWGSPALGPKPRSSGTLPLLFPLPLQRAQCPPPHPPPAPMGLRVITFTLCPARGSSCPSWCSGLGDTRSPACASVPPGDGTLHLPKPPGQPQLSRRC